MVLFVPSLLIVSAMLCHSLVTVRALSRVECLILSQSFASPVSMIVLIMFILSNVVFPKHKLRFPGHQVSWVSVIEWHVCDLSLCASSAMDAAKETKFGTKVAYGVRMKPKLCEYKHSADKSALCYDTAINEPLSIMNNNCNVTCFLVTALCNQPEACALDLGDNQSRYLCVTGNYSV